MKEDLGSFMELARIQSEINRHFDNLLDLRSAGSGSVTAKWVPNADVLAGRDRLIIRFELPGVDPKDIRVAMASGDLILSGNKLALPPGESARLHSSDRGQGDFRRVIHLGITTNPHQARATLRDGLLTVEIPRVANRRGEEVPIRVNEEASVDA
ncbi:MAG: Hsp20/alpha crystallin family protein [Acidobacteria bacterium]|nr:Hsp20/alpha crystallin family protein [Acidobacteriota bacterium]